MSFEEAGGEFDARLGHMANKQVTVHELSRTCRSRSASSTQPTKVEPSSHGMVATRRRQVEARLVHSALPLTRQRSRSLCLQDPPPAEDASDIQSQYAITSPRRRRHGTNCSRAGVADKWQEED